MNANTVQPMVKYPGVMFARNMRMKMKATHTIDAAEQPTTAAILFRLKVVRWFRYQS